MSEIEKGVDGAAAVVSAWLGESTLPAHAQHLANLAAADSEAAQHLVIGLTMLAAGLAYSLSETIRHPLDTVLVDMSTAVKNAAREAVG